MKLKNWVLFEPKEKFSGWLKLAFVLGLFSLINYLPALDDYYEPFASYQGGNLSSIGTGILGINVFPVGSDKNDYTFYWEMMTARQLLTDTKLYYTVPSPNPQVEVTAPKLQIPLWRWDDRDGGRPLLGISPAPLLYPFTGIFYLGNLTFFAVFHLWLALLGSYLLSNYFPTKIKLLGRPLLLLVVFIFLPQLRLDFEAGLTWWLIGLALALTLAQKRFSIKLAVLSLIFAMLWLTVTTPLSLTLIGALALWWLFVAGWKNNWRGVPLFKGLSGLVLALLLGTLIAGPQLFPRLFDRMEPYQLPPEQTPIYLPATVKLVKVVKESETEIVYNLVIEEGSAPVQLTIPERYDSGWTSEYRTNFASPDYKPIPLNRTTQGWRSIILPAFPDTTSVEMRTTFNPVSFQIGVWCFLGGLAVWLIITGFAVYPVNKVIPSFINIGDMYT